MRSRPLVSGVSFLIGLIALAIAYPADGQDANDLPLVYQEDFEQGAEKWEPTDPNNWRIEETPMGKVYAQIAKQSKYEPPHRSPLNISLLKDVVVGDFVLEAKLKSTIPDYGHRDMCLFFGHQDKAHFYYVHLGKQMDDHANQIFIVNNAPRTKISTKTTPGTNWTDNWHRVKIVRRVADGTIEVYFDDMTTPVMTAVDKTFTSGRIGIGSFDDTGMWDDIKLYGKKVAAGRK
jgi:hypothetical protein